jgi:hypothetical protein
MIVEIGTEATQFFFWEYGGFPGAMAVHLEAMEAHRGARKSNPAAFESFLRLWEEVAVSNFVRH